MCNEQHKVTSGQGVPRASNHCCNPLCTERAAIDPDEGLFEHHVILRFPFRVFGLWRPHVAELHCEDGNLVLVCILELRVGVVTCPSLGPVIPMAHGTKHPHAVQTLHWRLGEGALLPDLDRERRHLPGLQQLL
eukprot:CAMPEP_0171063494 /NCGR_PEP_ID=MMETSP0766_2-20121228/5695_1 /TAXON_ID=439317 /ORGANISM="Gambierdiscus australes, Strain CAWD 149" /LENGTH=133 /DNA_ID=CAMNT_0011519411 /DNA_START=169 /DNA_END=570 /DNA_ORIENTATION=+